MRRAHIWSIVSPAVARMALFCQSDSLPQDCNVAIFSASLRVACQAANAPSQGLVGATVVIVDVVLAVVDACALTVVVASTATLSLLPPHEDKATTDTTTQTATRSIFLMALPAEATISECSAPDIRPGNAEWVEVGRPRPAESTVETDSWLRGRPHPWRRDPGHALMQDIRGGHYQFNYDTDPNRRAEAALDELRPMLEP